MHAVIENSPQLATRTIYNHDILNCTADGVVGNHLYSGRALGITEPWDKIQLHEDLRSLWPDITAHYDRIGLRYTKDVLWYLNLKQLGSHIGYQPSVFYYGPDEWQNWGDFDWYKTVEYINSKNNFINLAKTLGIKVPSTLCFDSISQVKESDLQDLNFPCYLKAAISVSGVGIYRCRNLLELLGNLEKFEPEIPVQIQEEIHSDTFLNLQYQVSGKHLIRLAASEQILDGYMHQGNRVPARHAPWKVVEPMANWLMDHGIKGIFAFDIAAAQTKSGLRFFAIECNPRFNGATYPTIISKKLGIKQWCAITCHSTKTHLSELDIEDIEYDSKTGRGVIIVNWGTILAGKIVFLLAGSSVYQDALKIELAARLC